jgi:hypothetical protein
MPNLITVGRVSCCIVLGKQSTESAAPFERWLQRRQAG